MNMNKIIHSYCSHVWHVCGASRFVQENKYNTFFSWYMIIIAVHAQFQCYNEQCLRLANLQWPSKDFFRYLVWICILALSHWLWWTKMDTFNIICISQKLLDVAEHDCRNAWIFVWYFSAENFNVKVFPSKVSITITPMHPNKVTSFINLNCTQD